jgi:5-methyltetrahydropteroyltriglutamate--homocysteine methyltransferase
VIVGPATFLLLSKASDEAPEGFRPLRTRVEIT